MATTVRRVEPDAEVVAEFNADYADAFAVPTSARHGARDWAVSSLRGAEAAGGAFSRLVWSGVLGFRLAKRNARNTLLGWTITTEEPGRFALDTDGRLMAARMVFVVGDADVTWTTMLRYHRPAAERVWAVAGHVHRALAQRLLAHAVASLERQAGGRSADR